MCVCASACPRECVCAYAFPRECVCVCVVERLLECRFLWVSYAKIYILSLCALITTHSRVYSSVQSGVPPGAWQQARDLLYTATVFGQWPCILVRWTSYQRLQRYNKRATVQWVICLLKGAVVYNLWEWYNLDLWWGWDGAPAIVCVWTCGMIQGHAFPWGFHISVK